MDLNATYLWKYGDNDEREKIIALTREHLNSLTLANEGNETIYGIDLANKVDTSSIGLVGHSRGSQVIFDIAYELKKQGKNISSLLAIAPAVVNADTNYLQTDIDIAIVVPELDGDVISLDGYGVYDLLATKERKSLLSLTLLENANHNYFNSNVEKNDGVFWEFTKDISDQLTREEQEDFIGDFSVGFFNASIKNEVENTIYDKNYTSVTSMYGYNTKNLIKNSTSKEIIDINNKDNFISDKVSIEATTESIFYQEDKTSGFILPMIGNDKVSIKNLINFKWQEKGSKVTFKPTISDFSTSSTIDIDIAQDSSDKLNNNENQAFSIEIKDKKGNTLLVVIDKDTNLLEYEKGDMKESIIGDYTHYYWSNLLFLNTIRIPLNNLEGIDLSNIQEISLIFDKTDTGSIMISSFDVE